MGKGAANKRQVLVLPSSVTVDFDQLAEFPGSKIATFSDQDLLDLRNRQSGLLEQYDPLLRRLDEVRDQRLRLLRQVTKEQKVRFAKRRVEHAQQTQERGRSTAPFTDLLKGKMGLPDDLPLSHVLVRAVRKRIAYTDSLHMCKASYHSDCKEVTTVGELTKLWKKGVCLTIPNRWARPTREHAGLRLLKFTQLLEAWSGKDSGSTLVVELSSLSVDLRHLAESVVMHAKGDCLHDTYDVDAYEEALNEEEYEREVIPDPWE